MVYADPFQAVSSTDFAVGDPVDLFEADDGMWLIELPEDDGLDAAAPPSADGFLAAYARRGFADGRVRGFREAVALTSLAAEELIAHGSLEDLPPALVRRVAAALTARLDGHAPTEPFVEGGLGI